MINVTPVEPRWLTPEETQALLSLSGRDHYGHRIRWGAKVDEDDRFVCSCGAYMRLWGGVLKETMVMQAKHKAACVVPSSWMAL